MFAAVDFLVPAKNQNQVIMALELIVTTGSQEDSRYAREPLLAFVC